MTRAEKKRQFEEELEFALTRSVKRGKSSQLKGFWCDGISLDQSSILKDNVEILEGTAYFGPSGQDRYHINIKLGMDAAGKLHQGENFVANLDLQNYTDWYRVSVPRRTIEVAIE